MIGNFILIIAVLSSHNEKDVPANLSETQLVPTRNQQSK